MAGKRGRPKKVKEKPVPDVPVSAASNLDANGSKKEDIDDGSNLTCPKCSRVFTSSLGLKYHTDNKVCEKSPAKKSAKKKQAPIKSSKKGSKQSPLKIESEDEAEEAIGKISRKPTGKKPLKRQREEESESEYDYGDSDEEESDEEPRAKKSRMNTPSKKLTKSPAADLNDTLKCPSCGRTFKSKLGLKGHVEKNVCTRSKEKLEAVEKKEPMVCNTCNKSFTSKAGFRYHTKNGVCKTTLADDEPNEDTQPTGRRAARNNYKLDEDSEESDSDDDASVVSTKAKGTKRKRISTNESESEGRIAKEAPVEEDYQCPICFKTFTSSYGLKYHKNQNVCQRRKSGTDEDGLNDRFEYYRQAKPGSRFVTKFGIVKVIADSRLPAGHHKTKRCRKCSAERFERRKHTHECKQRDVAESIYTGGRMRRQKLQMLQESTVARPADMADSSLSTKIWNMYCETLNRHQILNERTSWKDVNGSPHNDLEVDLFTEVDPRLAQDYYPNRIVECELVNDERVRIESNGNNPKQEKPGKSLAGSKIRLFLARNELIEVYDETAAKYVCSTCGKSFCAKGEWEQHTKDNLCSVELKSKHEERSARLEAREENLLDNEADHSTFLSMMHAVTKTKHVDVDFGNPCKIKPHKKHKMPSWIVFNEQHTSMYPELFIAMNFKRGSQNRNWAGKIKTAEDYVHANDRKINRKLMKKKVLKYEMKSSVEQETAQQESAKRKAKITAKITADMVHTFALQQAAKQEEAKKQGKRVNTTNKLHDFALQQAAKQEQAKEEAKKERKTKLMFTQHLNTDSSSLPPPLPSIDTDDLFGEDVIVDYTGTDYSQPNAEINAQATVHSHSAVTNVASSKAKKSRMRKKKSKESKKSGEGNRSLSLVAPSDSNDPATVDAKMPGPLNGNTGEAQDTGVKLYLKGRKNPVVIDSQILVAECDGGRYPTIARFEGDHSTECVLCTRKDADDEDPLVECDFCKNAVHQICLNKKMLNKEPPIIIRELEPHDSVMCHDCMMYCIARRARAESRRTSKWHYELSRVGLSHPDAANLAEEVDLSKGSAENDTDDNTPTYSPCPNGGPGGLICCSHCTASYSRSLSNTAKEMELQSIAKAGQEMNEILDLLADAKQRLLNATDVSQANEIRRKLLRNNEV